MCDGEMTATELWNEGKESLLDRANKAISKKKIEIVDNG